MAALALPPRAEQLLYQIFRFKGACVDANVAIGNRKNDADDVPRALGDWSSVSSVPDALSTAYKGDECVCSSVSCAAQVYLCFGAVAFGCGTLHQG